MKTAMERWCAKVALPPSEGGCWNWTAALSDGYGAFSWNGRSSYRAHRYGYERFVGPVPDGLQLDHLCRNKRCVNPGHLEAVTQQVNMARSNGVSAKNARKTHCKYGHEFTQENTLIREGVGRVCRACLRCERYEYEIRKFGHPKRRPQLRTLV